MPIIGSLAGASSRGLGGLRTFGPVGPIGSYDLIQTVVSNGSATYFDFTSIPQTYNYLELRGFGSNTTGSYANIAVRMNSDASSNYYTKWAVSNANNLSSSAYNATEMSGVQSFPVGTQMGIAVITIFDYTSTSKLKGMTCYGGASQPSSSVGEVSYGNGQWASTSAITSIRVFNAGNPTWTSGTTFSLYGIGA